MKPEDQSSSRNKPARAANAPRRVVIDFDLLRKAGGSNLRDLGGCPTLDGRRVREGMIYRSAHLAELDDAAALRALKLRTLITLQSRMEVSVLGPPQRAILSSVRWEHIPIGDRWFDEQAPPPVTNDPARGHLVLVMDFREAWRRFFSVLAERGVYPLLFHCSAGRDRTGVGAAMLLELLGVDRERIAADFMRSNLVFPKMPLVAEQLAPLFQLIDQSGGIRAFMCKAIGVPASSLEAIRSGLIGE